MKTLEDAGEPVTAKQVGAVPITGIGAGERWEAAWFQVTDPRCLSALGSVFLLLCVSVLRESKRSTSVQRESRKPCRCPGLAWVYSGHPLAAAGLWCFVLFTWWRLKAKLEAGKSGSQVFLQGQTPQ